MKYISHFLILCLSISTMCTRQKSLVVMLDPAGDAQYTGRIIDDYFERGITLQYAEMLKQRVESLVQKTRIILTRFPGETIEPLQNAEFANKMDAHLYISIHLHQISAEIPIIALYTLAYNPAMSPSNNHRVCDFVRYDNVHIYNQSKSITFAQIFVKTLQKQSASLFQTISGPFSLPFKPLAGIKAPAFAIELGIAHKYGWHVTIEPLAQALAKLIHDIQANQ